MATVYRARTSQVTIPGRVVVALAGLLALALVTAGCQPNGIPIQSGPGGTVHPSGTPAPSGSSTPTSTPSPTPTGTPTPSPPSTNCTLIVPANPLSAAGLSTPYQMTATDPTAGPCHEANIAQSAFVQGAILTPGGNLTLYDPLVIDAGTQPAVPPAMAQVPQGATVALWFGFNGDNLTIRSADGTNSLAQGNCVNGLNGSIFGQFADCNAAAFFQSANALIRAGTLRVPAVGQAKDGLPCPTVRDFSVIDQDQSDNVTAQYLALPNGQTAQRNAAAVAAMGNNTVDLANASDNLLLDVFILPTLGCAPWTQPNGANDGQAESSLPLNELQAMVFQAAPVALVPLNNPMTLVNNNQSAAKTNLYRAGVDQPQIGAGASGDGATYCTNLFNDPRGIRRVFAGQTIFAAGPSPDQATGTNLFTFLAARANESFDNLSCASYGLTNPITLTLDGNGVVTAATIAPATGVPATTPAPSTVPASPTATRSPTRPPTTRPAPPRNGRHQVGMRGRFRNW
ncbi:hypothetical protein [Pseudofrankia inefficax]|nr:hypothetical protein [Pseudofrankia inefficax]